MKRMAEMARAIGKPEEATAFEAASDSPKPPFKKAVRRSQPVFIAMASAPITAACMPTSFRWRSGSSRDKVAGVVSWLRERDMDCSVYAAQYLLDGLFQNGADDKAIDLIVADNDRSWKHMVDSGTTITWEAWDMKYKPNQDWNHAWGAAPANLLPRHVLGAQPAVAGWQTALIRPCPGRLKHANGKVPTARGPIEIDWKQRVRVPTPLQLPEGMAARVDVPATDGSTGVFIDGDPVDATAQR